MIVAVSDEQMPVFRHKHSVGAIQAATFWLSIRAVSFKSIADNGFHDLAAGAVHANGVTFSIGEPDITIGRDSDAFRAGQLSLTGWPAVTGVAAFSGTGEVVQGLFLEIDAEQGVAFPKCQKEGVVTVEVESTRAVQGCSREACTVRCGASVSGTCKRRDDSGFWVHATNSMIADIADVEISELIKGDGVGLSHFCVDCRATVT